MNEIFVVFPHLVIDKPRDIWGVKFECELDKKYITIKCEYSNDEEEKIINRRMKVIRSHLMLACYLVGKDPSLFCKMQKGRQEKYDDLVNLRLSIESLIDILPKNIEDSAITVYWFSRYLETNKDERNQIIFLYNALGTLPGGYEQILSLSDSIDDKQILQALLTRIDDLHKKDNEDETYMEKTSPFTIKEIKKLELCYIRCLLNTFTEIKRPN